MFTVFSWQSTRLQEFLKWSIEMDPGRNDIQIARLYMYICSIKYVHMHMTCRREWLQESRQKNRDDSPWSLTHQLWYLFAPHSPHGFLRGIATGRMFRTDSMSLGGNCTKQITGVRGSLLRGMCRGKSFLDFHNLYEMTSLPMRSDGFELSQKPQMLGTTSYKTSGAHHPVKKMKIYCQHDALLCQKPSGFLQSYFKKHTQDIGRSL